MKIKIIQNLIDTIRRKNKNIFGGNNKIVAIKNSKEFPLKLPKNVHIKGNNNTIIFHCDKIEKIIKTFPKGLTISIKGNHNKIEIEYPIKIKNVKISMNEDKNYFSIKSTKHNFSNAYFCISELSSCIIGKDCELGNGGLTCIAASNYKTPHKLIIGDNCHIARETIIRTSDGQFFVDPLDTTKVLDPPDDVIIGNNVWIMTRCMIIKGSYIPDGCAVAAYSLVNKKFEEENCLLAGIPAKVKKQNIKWIPMRYNQYMESLEK